MFWSGPSIDSRWKLLKVFGEDAVARQRHGEAVGFGGGLGVTPGVALAYAVVAAGFFAVEKFSASPGIVSHPETPLAAPAE